LHILRLQPLNLLQLKTKVNLSQYLANHYVMKNYGGVYVYIHGFFTSALVGGEWSASRPGRFIPDGKAPGTHWKGGWLGPRAGLDDMEDLELFTLPGLEL
jgi:hypothetical protein